MPAFIIPELLTNEGHTWIQHTLLGKDEISTNTRNPKTNKNLKSQFYLGSTLTDWKEMSTRHSKHQANSSISCPIAEIKPYENL